MKKLFTLLSTLLVFNTTNASMFDEMSKEQLADYEIVVLNKKTGNTVGRMSRAEYKVVSLDSSENDSLKLQLAQQQEESHQYIEALHNSVASLHKEVVKSKEPYNSLIMHLGVGKDGLDRSYNNGTYEITEKNAGVIGATGCRTYDKKGICATATTNSTFLFGLKFDFK